MSLIFSFTGEELYKSLSHILSDLLACKMPILIRALIKYKYCAKMKNAFLVVKSFRKKWKFHNKLY